MTTKMIFSASALLAIGSLLAFTPLHEVCDGIFFKEGARFTTTSYDENNKISGSSKTHLIRVENIGSEVKATAQVERLDKKGKSLGSGEYVVRCKENILYFDMRNMMPQQQSEAFKDMEIAFEGIDVAYPANITVGAELPDAKINCSFKAKGNGEPIPFLAFNASTTNRKVVSKENITTPAGTFECFKITEDFEINSIIRLKTKSINWYNKKYGSVRTESYRENGKLLGSTQITEHTF
jgi:hypothetical protein